MAAYLGPRDGHAGHQQLADTIYGIVPSRALDLSSCDIRAASLSSKRYQQSKSSPPKRKGTSDLDTGIFPHRRDPRAYWTAAKGSKRGRLHIQQDAHGELHQSTCLNLSTAVSAESDLWILPDFDEWEVDQETSVQLSMKQGGEWAPLVERAVNSNRERLRRRLEGDGWDFVGGNYGDEEKVYEVESASEGSVDEEFDVVVLPMVSVS